MGEEMKIEAAVARAKFAPLLFEDIELEEPRHDEVRVRILATGVCHTDMAIRDQTIVPMRSPLFLATKARALSNWRVKASPK
jgi:aryl-alcohol dehydrogenase